MEEIIDKELEAIKDAGTWKSERVITSQQQASIGINTRDDRVLNFCANNYLGLSVVLMNIFNEKYFFGHTHKSTFLFLLKFSSKHKPLIVNFMQNHPEIVKAAKDCLDNRGSGLSSVRFICGTQVQPL